MRAQLATQSVAQGWQEDWVDEKRKLELVTFDGYLRTRPDLFYKFDMGRGNDTAGYSLFPRVTQQPQRAHPGGRQHALPLRADHQRVRRGAHARADRRARQPHLGQHARLRVLAQRGQRLLVRSQRVLHLLGQPDHPAQRHQQPAGLHRRQARVGRGLDARRHPALRPHGQPLGPGHAAQRRQRHRQRLRRHRRPRQLHRRAARRLLHHADDRLQHRGPHLGAHASRAGSRSTSRTPTTRTATSSPRSAATPSRSAAPSSTRTAPSSTTACTSPTARSATTRSTP